MTSTTSARAQRFSAVAALVAASVMLTACGFSVSSNDQRPECTRDSSATDSALSAIDPEGISCIVESRRARFDMSAGAIDKEALGVPIDEYAPDVSSDDELIRLEILAPKGVVVASTDRIRFFTTDTSSTVDRITYFLVADTEKELFGLLRAGVDDYGIDGDSVESWITDVSDDPQATSDFAFAPATALGVNVTYDVRFDASASKQVIIVDVYPI